MLIISRTDPLKDLRITTITNASLGDVHFLRVISGATVDCPSIELTSRNRGRLHLERIAPFGTKLTRLLTFLQSNALVGKINKIVSNFNIEGPLVIIDADLIRVGAMMHQSPSIIDIHDNAFEPALPGPKYAALAMWYRFLARRYIKCYSTVITVSSGISRHISYSFGVQPMVIPNVNRYCKFENAKAPKILSSKSLRFVHHGIYGEGRHSDRMFNAFKTHRLHLATYFINYREWMRHKYANDLTTVEEPVEQDQIMDTLAKYDCGAFYFEDDANKNMKECLPNKFFEFVYAGLPLVFGPSNEVEQILEQYQIGLVAKSAADLVGIEARIRELTSAPRYLVDRAQFLRDYSFERASEMWRNVLMSHR